MVSMQLNNALVEIVDAKSFAAAVADEIVASVNEAVSENGKCFLALAGGSTPSATYRLLSRPPRVKEFPWNKTYFFWGDERWAPQDSAQSNYHMTMETLFSGGHTPTRNIFPIDTSLKSPANAAAAYSKLISSQLASSADGIPIFDVLLLGLGNDGHTASLFPGFPALKSTDICLATDRPDGLQAVTLGRSVLCHARRVIFLVAGEDKAEMVQKVLEQNMAYQQAPAALYREMDGRVIWFLDTAAAKNLEKRQTESA